MDFNKIKKEYQIWVDKISQFAIDHYNKEQTPEIIAEFDALWSEWVRFYNAIPKDERGYVECFVSKPIMLELKREPKISIWLFSLANSFSKRKKENDVMNFLN